MAAELGTEPGSQFLTLRPDHTSVQHSLPLLLLPKPLQLCPGLKRQLSKALGCPGTGRFSSHLLLCRTRLLRAASEGLSSFLGPARHAQWQCFWLWACCSVGSLVLFIIGEDFLRRFIKYWARGLLSIWCHRNTNKEKNFYADLIISGLKTYVIAYIYPPYMAGGGGDA